jgi:hypothetical protein
LEVRETYRGWLLDVFLRKAKICNNCSRCPSRGFAWYWDSRATSNNMSTRPISVAHRSTPINSW